MKKYKRLIIIQMAFLMLFLSVHSFSVTDIPILYEKSDNFQENNTDTMHLPISSPISSAPSSLLGQISTTGNAYDVLVDGILSKDINENRYYELCRMAKELLSEFRKLEEDNVFSLNAEYKSKILQKEKQDLAIKFKNFNSKNKQTKINRILNVKKLFIW